MFFRKEFEYDVYKKERRCFYLIVAILLIIAGFAYYYYGVYLPENRKLLVATEFPMNTTWVDVPYHESVTAPIQNTKEDRDPVKYYNVIAQFNVEESFRYQINNSEKFDNIFVWDVITSMGLIFPHYLSEDFLPARSDNYMYVGDSNIMAHFLEIRGGEYGWQNVDGYEAQMRANQGYPTIAVWKNPDADKNDTKEINNVPLSRPSGHLMIVRPSPTGTGYKRSKGPYITHAGENNSMLANISDVFGLLDRSEVIYYTHD